MSRSQDWWDGYQACVQDAIDKSVSIRGERVGFLAKASKDTVGEYCVANFNKPVPLDGAPIGYAVSVAGMVSMASCTNALEDGTYLLHATKISDNVQMVFGFEAVKKLFGEQR